MRLDDNPKMPRVRPDKINLILASTQPLGTSPTHQIRPTINEIDPVWDCGGPQTPGMSVKRIILIAIGSHETPCLYKGIERSSLLAKHHTVVLSSPSFQNG